jgi:hypothetical protein
VEKGVQAGATTAEEHQMQSADAVWKIGCSLMAVLAEGLES